MAVLTFSKPNGEWGIDGVNLSALPPKVYVALCKLHELEYDDRVALAFFAERFHIPLRRLEDFIEGERR